MAEKPIYRCWTKATNREAGPPRRSENWITSRRAWFEVFPDRVECGDWRIPYGSVDRAVAYRTRALFTPATVLELRTAEGTYQFGFNPWAHPDRHLPIPIEEQRVRLGYSPVSILLRVVLLAWLAYLLWDWLS